jgi:hypothetical protein
MWAGPVVLEALTREEEDEERSSRAAPCSSLGYDDGGCERIWEPGKQAWAAPVKVGMKGT